MEQRTVYVGIDYHASFCQVCVLDAGGDVVLNGRCRSDVGAIIERASVCGRVERLAIESCSGAAELGHELVAAAGWRVSLAHPGYVRRMKHNPDKSDMADARILADLCRAGYLPEVWLAPTFIRELRSLVRYRFQNVQERSRIKTRILGLLRDQRRGGIKIVLVPCHRDRLCDLGASGERCCGMLPSAWSTNQPTLVRCARADPQAHAPVGDPRAVPPRLYSTSAPFTPEGTFAPEGTEIAKPISVARCKTDHDATPPPILAIPISFVGRRFGASAWSDPAVWFFLVSPAVVIGPLLIATAFAVAHAKGHRKSRRVLLGTSVFLAGLLVGGVAWVTSMLYFLSTYSGA